MTPTDTIREALRRCPVKKPSGCHLKHLPGGTWIWQYDNGYWIQADDPYDAMIAAWVKALLSRGWVLDPDALNSSYQPYILILRRPTIDHAVKGQTLLDALAAAVVAVMPEPEDKQ